MGNMCTRVSSTSPTLELSLASPALELSLASPALELCSSNEILSRKKTDIVVNDSVFPPEIMIEILSRLPIQCLGRVKVVCKQWYALINDRYFIEKSMRPAPCNFLYNIIPNPNDSRSKCMHVYACDGLRLTKYHSTGKYIVRNYATKQFLELPDPHKGTLGIVFSYVPSISNYKFVSIYDDENKIERCEILSFEDDEFLWRPLEIPNIKAPNRNRKKFFVVPTGDAVHCVRVIAVGASTVEEVISLDLGSEHFTISHLPSGQYKSWERVWPINFNGKLCIVDRIGDDLSALVLEDYKCQKWGKKKVLIPLASMKSLEDLYGTIIPQCFDPSGILWLRVQDKMFISYDMNGGLALSKVVDSEGRKVCDTLDFSKYSLVSLKGMKPEPEKPEQSSSNQV